MSDELTLDAAVVRIGELVRDVDKLNTNWKNELSRRVDAETERDALALQLQSVKDALAQVVAENTANVAAARELLEACWYQFANQTTVKGVLGHNDGGLSVLADVREYLWPGSETHIPVAPANG